MGRRAARVYNSFGNAFVIEVGNLLAKDEVFEQGRATLAGFERVLVVVYSNALIGGKKFAAAVLGVLLQVVDLGVVISRIKLAVCSRRAIECLGFGQQLYSPVL